MEEKYKCSKCGIELFYKPKNKLSIAMCIECYYKFKKAIPKKVVNNGKRNKK